MADWWEATGDNYLGRVPKSLISEALIEAGEGDAGREVANLKKAEAVARAQAALAGKRWRVYFGSLPPVALRRATRLKAEWCQARETRPRGLFIDFWGEHAGFHSIPVGAVGRIHRSECWRAAAGVRAGTLVTNDAAATTYKGRVSRELLTGDWLVEVQPDVRMMVSSEKFGALGYQGS